MTVTLECGTCQLCCHGETVPLLEDQGDDRALYDPAMLMELHPAGTPLGQVLALRHKKNGDCIALGPDGCTIYGIRPIICREFDCRAAYLKVAELFPSRKDRRRLASQGHLDPKVFVQGKKMLDRDLGL